MFNFRWSAEQSEQKTLTKIQKHEKGPLSHQKIKCSFLDYVQLLMIGCLIWVVNGDWNAKKQPPKSSKNKMFIFWWSTRRLLEDHQKTVKRLPEDQQKTTRRLAEDKQKTTRRLAEDKQKTTRRLAEDKQKTGRRLSEDQQKTVRRPPDHQLSDLSKKHWPKCKKKKTKKGPLSHQKIKCSFLDYIQLLMISWAIWAKNVDQNTKKWKGPPKSSKNKMSIFGLHSTSDDWPSDMSKKHQPKCTKMKKTP